MTAKRILTIVVYSALVLALVAAVPQAVDETLEVSLSLTGKMDADRRVSKRHCHEPRNASGHSCWQS
jgi:hypothetical protein